MPSHINIDKIDTLATIHAVSETLRRIDRRLVDHGERVAYIACAICDQGNLNLNRKKLFLLSVFHDIGAYKTDEIDRMLEFETNDVENHSIYGYLFLKYMSPLFDSAEAILYHHTRYDDILKANIKDGEYAALIHLADRIDVALTFDMDREVLRQQLFKSPGLFNEEYVELAMQCIKETALLQELSDKVYRTKNIELCQSFIVSSSEALEYLKMIVYIIDFRSEHTVTHTINTISLALDISRHFNLDDNILADMYLGALLHDVGKIAIPEAILEYPGKLSDEQMKVMRTHVDETEAIIGDIIPQNICNLALRHHEKLDGSGYPLGLTGADLTFPERIVAVADIVSALSSRRSYKDPFPKDKTIMILNDMAKTKLDKDICQYVIDEYDNILNRTEGPRQNVINTYKNIMNEYHQLQKK